MYDEEKYFVLGSLEQPRQDKNLMYRHDEPGKSTKEGPLSFVLLESPFAKFQQSALATPSPVLADERMGGGGFGANSAITKRMAFIYYFRVICYLFSS